jgi:hypothetical protein
MSRNNKINLSVRFLSHFLDSLTDAAAPFFSLREETLNKKKNSKQEITDFSKELTKGDLASI